MRRNQYSCTASSIQPAIRGEPESTEAHHERGPRMTATHSQNRSIVQPLCPASRGEESGWPGVGLFIEPQANLEKEILTMSFQSVLNSLEFASARTKAGRARRLRVAKARLSVELLEDRCLLSNFTLGPLVQVAASWPWQEPPRSVTAHSTTTKPPAAMVRRAAKRRQRLRGRHLCRQRRQCQRRGQLDHPQPRRRRRIGRRRRRRPGHRRRRLQPGDVHLRRHDRHRAQPRLHQQRRYLPLEHGLR